MTDRSFGHGEWYGVVVNVDDEQKEGRVQVRIHGLHDDEQNIKNEDLFWIKPHQDITSAGHNKIGKSPVGLIKGATVSGIFHDVDKQIPIMRGTIAKAGDASTGSTQNNQTTLQDGTNSTPIAERNKNNKFVTRKGRNIYDDDHNQAFPTESNDSDGDDITADATKKTKFATIPTVGSVTSPSGSILQQLTNVDPQRLTSVLKQAVPNFMKIADINSFSSVGGVTNVLGQVLGQAMSAIGTSTAMNAIAANVDPTQLSAVSQQAILTALQNLGPQPNSQTILNIIGGEYSDILAALLNLINTKTLNAATLEALLQLHFSNIQANGTQATIGATQDSVLGLLSSVLPQLSGPINSTLNDHLPPSVLNQQTVTDALKKFAMSQAILKKPTDGKKALAMAAVQQTPDFTSIFNQVSGLTSQAQTFLQGLIPNFP